MFKITLLSSKLLIATIIFIPSISWSLSFSMKKDSDIIGEIREITIKNDENMRDIARKYDVGLTDMLEANPHIKNNEIKSGTKLIIPSAYILPPGPRTGIVLNLAELRLYFYKPDSSTVVTHPVGIGRLGWRTPVGETKIIKKRENPTWRPPNSIRQAYARKGKKLPTVVPAGPNNPLGGYAMNLGWPRYLIHGTNRPQSVGLRSSSGCIRMYPEDIQSLYQIVPKNTSVRIIHEPFKVGKKNSELYLEAHEPLAEPYYGTDPFNERLDDAVNMVYQHYRRQIDWAEAKGEIRKTVGYPILISN